MENVPATVKLPKKRLSAKNKKKLAVNIIVGLVTSFVLAVLVMLCDLEAYVGAADFFSPKVFIKIVIVFGIMAFMLAALFGYMFFVRKDFFTNGKLVPLVCCSLMLTYVICVLVGQYVNLYVVPLMLSALLVATLVDRRAGIMANIIISQVFFVTFMLIAGGESVVESAAALLTSMVAGVIIIMLLGKATSRLKFLGLGICTGLVCAAIPMLINLLLGKTELGEILMIGLWSFLSTVCSLGLYMIILPLLEYIFKVDTSFRLAELCTFDYPLLKKLAKEAPGTFYHSLVVGNLAELCASAIGENAQLAKACAYFHDVGKMKNPEFFVENQKGGENVHDELIPEVSVKIITQHTADGYKMLKDAGLPDAIANVAREHHGTTPVKYFYYKAQNLTEDQLASYDFSYTDPKPSTKIAAIIMIVDTVEAAIRAVGVNNDLRQFIHKLIKEKADLDQFSDCPLTFKDLQTIEDTLVETVPNMYHNRIKYDNK